jgi:hypothetical protein
MPEKKNFAGLVDFDQPPVTRNSSLTGEITRSHDSKVDGSLVGKCFLGRDAELSANTVTDDLV